MPSVVGLLETTAPDATNNDLASNPFAQTKLARAIENHHFPASGRPYSTALPGVPVTLKRQVYIPSPDTQLVDPGTARVNLAVSTECPDGTPGWREAHAHETVLQQHVAYWDPDHDGIIYPHDLYHGCRAWDWHPALCILAVLIIAGGMSYPTLPAGKYLPDPRFPIYIDRIHKNKHGSDSNTYDSEGRFRPQQFEDFFVRYDVAGKGGLDLWDLARAWKGQRILADPFGWTAGFFEWLALYLLLWPQDGVVKKEDVRASFDGSLFQRKADEVRARRERRSG